MKNFNIMEVHQKVRFLGGNSWKTNILEELPKNGGFGEFCRFLGGLAKKRGLCIPLHGNIPLYCLYLQNGLEIFNQILQPWSKFQWKHFESLYWKFKTSAHVHIAIAYLYFFYCLFTNCLFTICTLFTNFFIWYEF